MKNLSSNLKQPFFIIVFFFILLFLYTKFAGPIPFSVNSVTTEKVDVFSVTGEGSVTAIPNLAQINLGLTVDGVNLATIQNEVNSKMNKLIADLKTLGIGPNYIKTTNYSVNPKYEYLGGAQKVSGFTVTTNLEVKVSDLTKINQVIDTATAAGANLVGGLNLTFDDETKEKLTAAARKIAIDKAKGKAKALETATGVKLGRIINVAETTAPEPPILIPAQAGGETQVQPGTGEVKVQVTISYQIL